MRTKLHTNLGEGLKRARKEKARRENRKKYSQQDFADDMYVTIDTVRNWEQDYNLPKTSDLLYMCELFDCDLDYLFMRTDVKKHDTEFIMEKTGLSERAVENVQRLNNDNVSALNTLLEDRDFLSVLANIADYQQALVDYDESYREFIEGINGLISEIAGSAPRTSESVERRTKADEDRRQKGLYLDAMQYKIDSSFQAVINNLKK